jgi:hypothetical protein
LRPAGVAAALVVLAAPDAPAPVEAPATRTALVHFADGNTLPLRNWTVSYEYVTWEKGRSPANGLIARRESSDLWIGRRAFPLAPGAVVAIEYRELRRETLVDGRPQSVISSAARAVTFSAGGRSASSKVEPPDRLFLVTGAPKSLNLLARSVDLRGDGITGTRREVCLLSYTSLVDCGASPAEQVVKVEFH